MKIIYIVPGFGGTFYCGNCLRDSALIRALRREGHEALSLPMYLPLTRSVNSGPVDLPVFYGAVGIYFRQRFPVFRNMPGWMERTLNSAPLLNLASRNAGSTRAHGLEEMTESMLMGKDGFQREELEQLVRFLKTEKPDVVHLSNALLLGLASRIREEVKVPVVYSLQDEDVWISAMEEPYKTRIWDLMAEKARDADAFIAVSRYFAGFMREKLNIPGQKLHVVHIGIDPENYEANSISTKIPAIGYLSRINEENGFGILVDAFIELKKQSFSKSLRLHFTGGMTRDDKPFFRHQIDKLKKNRLNHQVAWFPEFHPETLKNFFAGITALSVPVLQGEAFGLYQLEALASGIPLVQPAVGAFPEIIDATGGGVLYSPNTPVALASALSDLLQDPGRMELLGGLGREAVARQFNWLVLARGMTGIYRKIGITKPNNHAC
jgi:glycosyltransferase involved in cell wall biosynthesis